MTIRARYSGVCPDCEERWQPGDLIRSRPVGAEHRETWHHAHCPDPTTDRLIELEDFKNGLSNYVDDVSGIAMNPVGKISELEFGKENN